MDVYSMYCSKKSTIKCIKGDRFRTTTYHQIIISFGKLKNQKCLSYDFSSLPLW